VLLEVGSILSVLLVYVSRITCGGVGSARVRLEIALTNEKQVVRTNRNVVPLGEIYALVVVMRGRK